MKKFIVWAIAMLISVAIAGAQTTKESEKTTILQTVEVPTGTQLHEGTTKTGNPKFWVTMQVGDQSVKISVSPSLAKKHQSGSAKIEIVKRKNNQTGKISYSSRTAGGRTSKSVADVNLAAATFN